MSQTKFDYIDLKDENLFPFSFKITMKLRYQPDRGLPNYVAAPFLTNYMATLKRRADYLARPWQYAEIL